LYGPAGYKCRHILQEFSALKYGPTNHHIHSEINSRNAFCNLSSCFPQDDFVMEKPKNVILEDKGDNAPIFNDVTYSQETYCSLIELWIEEKCMGACHFGIIFMY